MCLYSLDSTEPRSLLALSQRVSSKLVVFLTAALVAFLAGALDFLAFGAVMTTCNVRN